MANESVPESNSRQKEFEELVKSTNPQVFDSLPRDVRPQVVQMISRVALKITEFSGPLPPPEQLRRYDQVLPGAADRIMAMAERQATHRMELEKLVVHQQLQQSHRGQVLAATLAVLFLAGALMAALTGHDSVAIALGTTTVLGLAGTFIVGRWEQKANLEQKALPSSSKASEN